jgi:hypothetical protein
MKRLRKILAEEGLRTAGSSFTDTVERWVDNYLNLDDKFESLGGRGGTNVDPDKTVIKKREIKGGKRTTWVYVELSASGVFPIVEDFSWEDYGEKLLEKLVVLTGGALANFHGGGNHELSLSAGKGNVWLLDFDLRGNGQWEHGAISAFVNVTLYADEEDEPKHRRRGKFLSQKGWKAGAEAEWMLPYSTQPTGDLDADAKAIAKMLKKAQSDAKAAFAIN